MVKAAPELPRRCRTCRCSWQSRRRDFVVSSRSRFGVGLAAERQSVGQTPSASCKGLTVPRIGVHWRGACRAIEHSGKAVGEDTEPHREEVRAVGGLGVG